MTHTEQPLPPCGSRWRERKPYEGNVVQITSHDAPADTKGRPRVWIDNVYPIRRRKALAERFNGRAYTPDNDLAERHVEYNYGH